MPVNMKYSTEQIVGALHETNGLVTLAARRLGCSVQTIYQRARKTQRIREAIEESRAELVDLAEARLRQAVLNGEPWAVALVLKTLGRSRGYVERQEIAGAGGDNLVIELAWAE